MDYETLNRARGAMLGQLAGDAFGSQYEFKSAEQLQDRFPKRLPHTIRGSMVWGTIAGQPTDDSEMALALAWSLVKSQGFNAKRAREAYVSWYNSRPFDIGGTTSKALSGWNAGVDERNWESQANGGLMRVSPIGIFGASFSDLAVMGMAATDTAMTHPNKVCVQASQVYAAAIAHAIRTGESAEMVWSFALKLATKSSFTGILPALEASYNACPVLDLVNQGWVLKAFQNAFWQLRNAKHPEGAIKDTSYRGGDTDTNAAIAGALLGAVYGESTFPADWLLTIEGCRPLKGEKDVNKPRPETYWPCKYIGLVDELIRIQEQKAAS